MSAETTRLLYLARHAEPVPGGAKLSEDGCRQAQQVGRRLAALPVERIVHGPLPRAAATADVVAAQFERRPSLIEDDAAGDYVPHMPRRDEVPDAWADAVASFLADVSEEEEALGARLGERAIDLLTGPAVDGRKPVDVVITHAFTVGWLVRHALGSPAWRWFPPAQCHAGLTVVRYEMELPPSVVVANDVAHLSPDLRWTGVPDHLRP